MVKSILSKWLFAAMVMLSFFTFSGFVSSSTIKINAPHTTLIVKDTGKPIKSVCYRVSGKLAAYSRWFNLSLVNQLARVSRSHTQNAQLSLKQASKLVVNNKICRFYRKVIYPQTPTDGTHLI